MRTPRPRDTTILEHGALNFMHCANVFTRFRDGQQPCGNDPSAVAVMHVHP